jgi:aspartate aminotransferase
MFESLPLAPPDPILGIAQAIAADPRPNKIDLTTGVFKDEEDRTPVLHSVKRAERLLLETEGSKTYLPIPGPENYGAVVREMLFGLGHEILVNSRSLSAQTPGGTGALRVAADFLAKHVGAKTVWISDPTWANHASIFKAAGLEVKVYPYYNMASRELDLEGMLGALQGAGAGEVLLLHACCHNPSGMDPDAQQWQAIADVARERGLLPLFDFAYQGFGDGLTEDAAGLRLFCESGCEMLVASSFSKNFGLYNERVGALTIVARNHDEAVRAMSNIKLVIRSNYSNPPVHGGAVVTTILQTPELRSEWERELAQMRGRIHDMRTLLADTLALKGAKQDFSFIKRQKGMFSFSGLNKEQVDRLREEFGVYVVGSGRMNIAGIRHANLEPLCDAIVAVVNG